MYSHLLKRGNAFFDKGDGKGMDLPYIAAWHQAPIHDARRENYRLNLQFFSFRRAANKIKYLAAPSPAWPPGSPTPPRSSSPSASMSLDRSTSPTDNVLWGSLAEPGSP